MAASGATPACIAAFHVFAGLPLAQGLEASDLQTWLAVGGGSMLWEELAAEFGHKPLVVGHTGPSAGVWASARLETVADLVGARVHAEGLAADVLRALGAAPALLVAADLRAAAGGRDGSRPPSGSVPSPQRRPTCSRWRSGSISPGFNRHGLLISLDVSQAAVGRHERCRPRDLRGLRSAGVSAVADGCGGARPDCAAGGDARANGRSGLAWSS